MKRFLCLTLCLMLLAALAAPALGFSIMRSNQALVIDGAEVQCEAYNIDGYNYFRLRDLAGLLSGTDCCFGVDWDAASRTVILRTGEDYDGGGEASHGRGDPPAAQRSNQNLIIDGQWVTGLSVYNIGGNNFFKLAELKDYLGYGLDYDEASRTILLYTDDTSLRVSATICVYSAADDKKQRDLNSTAASLGSVRSTEYAGFCFPTKNVSASDLDVRSAYVRFEDGSTAAWAPFTLEAGALTEFHVYRDVMRRLLPGMHRVEFFINDQLVYTQAFTLLRDWSQTMSLPSVSQQTSYRTSSRSPYIVCAPQFEGVTGYTEYAVDFIIEHEPEGTYVCGFNWDMDLSGLRQSYSNVWRAYSGVAAYAGFQVWDDGSHHAIFSVWDTYCQDAYGRVTTVRARQVYPSAEAKQFDGEGNGVQCLVPCDWKAGHSYRMLLQQSVSAETGNTKMALWICDLETGVWNMLIEYDLGVRNTWITGGCAFLENYLPDHAGELRSMELSNFRVRDKDSGRWVTAKQAAFFQDNEYPGSYNYGSDGHSFWAITTGIPNCCVLPRDWETYTVRVYEEGCPY